MFAQVSAPVTSTPSQVQTLASDPVDETHYDRVPWRTRRVSFQPQQTAVRDLLKEFAISQNLPLSLSDSVKGVSSGSFMDIETEKFLNVICSANDLVWFYDGVRLNIESTDEIISRPLSLPYVTKESLADILFSIGYTSGPPGRENQVKQGHRAGVILLVGGPHFIQATDTLARDLDAQEAKRLNEQVTVRTFRLNYASASDITINTGSTNRVVPGVVRSLQNLMTNQPSGSSMSTGAEETNIRRSHQSLLGQGLAAVGNPNPTNLGAYNPLAPGSIGAPSQSGFGNPGNDRVSNDPADPRAPMIVADLRLNAVLVRDVASRMPLYEDLIKMLDVSTQAIEISAAIVDIDSNNVRDLGIELLGSGQETKNGVLRLGRIGFDADRGNFDGNDTEGMTPSFLDGSNLARGAGLNVTGLVAGVGWDLLGRLRAIEQRGVGQVLSSPSVFTMENVEAVIRTQEKVYVRVEGNMATDLFDVSTGVQLRVTPTIVSEGGRSSFKLLIDITDGSFSDTRVDNIPSTRESGITTQAMVPESRTLLLGGYTVERRTNSDSDVPFLNKVPVLGKVLARTNRDHERRQRFFFITPRLVNLDHETALPAAINRGENPLEMNPRLPEPDLTRETPENMARRLASTTARTGQEVIPNPHFYESTPGNPKPQVQPAPEQQRKRESFLNRLFKPKTEKSGAPESPSPEAKRNVNPQMTSKRP